MPSPPATFTPYMRGVYIAYAVVTWAYFGVAFTGYWAYGSNVESNILFSLENPRGVIALASAMGTISQPLAALYLISCLIYRVQCNLSLIDENCNINDVAGR